MCRCRGDMNIAMVALCNPCACAEWHQQERARKLCSVTLINIDCLPFYFLVFSLILVSIDVMYQTCKTVFDVVFATTEKRVENTARHHHRSLLSSLRMGPLILLLQATLSLAATSACLQVVNPRGDWKFYQSLP